jgi:hypothetical protein
LCAFKAAWQASNPHISAAAATTNGQAWLLLLLLLLTINGCAFCISASSSCPVQLPHLLHVLEMPGRYCDAARQLKRHVSAAAAATTDGQARLLLLLLLLTVNGCAMHNYFILLLCTAATSSECAATIQM